MKINKREAVEMRKAGKSYADIGRRFGVTRQAVQKLLRSTQLDSFSSNPQPRVAKSLLGTMADCRISVTDLSQASGLTAPKLTQLMEGTATPTKDDKVRIEFALGKPIAW